VQTSNDSSESEDVPTGCNAEIGLAILIHKVQFYMPPPPNISGAWTLMEVASEDLTAITTQHHYPLSQCIAIVERNVKFTKSGCQAELMNIDVDYNPPICYAKDSIAFNCQSVLTGVKNSFAGRVGFTWVLLSKEEYLDALQSFPPYREEVRK